MVLDPKSHRHSIHTTFLKVSEGSGRRVSSGFLLTAIPAIIAVVGFCLTSLTGSGWVYEPFLLKIDYEAVNPWKEDNVQILCLLLTALLISLFITRFTWS